MNKSPTLSASDSLKPRPLIFLWLPSGQESGCQNFRSGWTISASIIIIRNKYALAYSMSSLLQRSSLLSLASTLLVVEKKGILKLSFVNLGAWLVPKQLSTHPPTHPPGPWHVAGLVRYLNLLLGCYLAK